MYKILTEEIFSNQITDLYKKHRYDEIANLKGIYLEENRNYKLDIQNHNDSLWYIKQNINCYHNQTTFPLPFWQPQNYVRTKQRKAHNIIIYYSDKNCLNENHAGILLDSNKVISKFGYGHIFKHPINLVPKQFGPYYSLYTKMPDSEPAEIATIQTMRKWLEKSKDINYINIDYTKNKSRNIIEDILGTTGKLVRKTSYGKFDSKSGQYLQNCIYKVSDGFLNDLQNQNLLQELYFEKTIYKCYST